jgi:hypothetical protein
MVYVYTLLLEQNKYYVGKTDNPRFRIESHFDASGSAWTKKYPPLKLLELIPDCDHFDEDKYTKVYMNKYGINNVRGGSFCQIELDKRTYEMLEKMIFSATDKCYLCGEEGHFIDKCPYENDEFNEVYYAFDTIWGWISSVKSTNPLFITKTFLIEIIKVDWFLINYEDRYSSDPIKKEKWKLSVIQIRKDLLNDKIDIDNIVKQISIVDNTLLEQLNKRGDQLHTRDRKERDLYTRKEKIRRIKLTNKTKILNMLKDGLGKLKTVSHLSFFDYFTDLLLINID